MQQQQQAQEAQAASALRGKLLHCNKGFVQIAMSSSFALEALLAGEAILTTRVAS